MRQARYLELQRAKEVIMIALGICHLKCSYALLSFKELSNYLEKLDFGMNGMAARPIYKLSISEKSKSKSANKSSPKASLTKSSPLNAPMAACVNSSTGVAGAAFFRDGMPRRC